MAERLGWKLGSGEDAGGYSWNGTFANTEIGGKKVFGSNGFIGQLDDSVPIGEQIIPGTNMVQLGTMADGDRGQKIFDYFVNGGYATYDPTYGWVAESDDVKNVSSSFFPHEYGDMLKGWAMIAGMAAGGALMGGAGGFMTGGEYLGGLGGEVLGGAGGFEGLGTAGLGELGSGTYGLTGTNGTNALTGGLLDPAVTGTNVFGDVIGTTTAGAGAGAGTGTVVNTVTNTFNPLDPSTWGNNPIPPGTTQVVDQLVDGVNEGGLDGPLGDSPGNYTDGMGTDNPLTTGGDTPGWLDRIIKGIAKDTDWLKLLGAGGGAIFDYLGDQAAGDKSMELWNAMMNSPGMTRFNSSFSPGWNIMDADPSFQGALDASANAFTRAASAKVGNVGGNPGAWNEIQTNVMNNTLAPWTTNYRNQNLAAAGLANSATTALAPTITGAAGSGWDNAGSFLGYLSGQNQQNPFGMSNDGKSINFGGQTWKLA